MFKFFRWRIATEAEVQTLINNTLMTAAKVAYNPQTGIKTDYDRGRYDAASDILLLV